MGVVPSLLYCVSVHVNCNRNVILSWSILVAKSSLTSMRSMRAREHRALRAPPPRSGLRVRRHSSHFTELYFSLYKRGHWAVLSANTRSHLLQLIIEFGMGISHMGGHGSAVVSQPVRCTVGVRAVRPGSVMAACAWRVGNIKSTCPTLWSAFRPLWPCSRRSRGTSCES